MDVNRTLQVAAVALSLGMSAPLSVAQATRSSYDPAGQRPTSKPRDGSFLDFTLKRINPPDRDYGQCLGEGRRIVLDETIKRGYFWSNLTALGVLICLFIIVVYQHRIQAKREWTISEILAQYEHALARSNQEVAEATTRNRTLAESLAALKQSAVRSLPLPADTPDRVPYRPVRSQTASTSGRPTMVSKGDDPAPPTNRPTATGAPTSSGGQIALFKPEVELVTKVNALEQQLGRSQQMEKQLRRQLNETVRKLLAEEKNQSAKRA